jgi:glycosyltransferase involved in cell wall biosynthesis
MQVSVIIPTYNSAQYLIAAVESVLAQTFKDFEILVIDDGSTDNTSEVIKQFKDCVRYIKQENQGVSVARNRGIKESCGKYVAFLDADDIWMPTKLERQIEVLKENPKSNACYTEYIAFSGDMKPTELKRLRTGGYVLNDLLLRGNVVGPPSALLGERQLFEKLGGFDSNLSLCADWDMWIRLALMTELTFLKEPLIKYRLHDSNMSKNVKLLEEDTLKLLEKSFAMLNLPEEFLAKRKEAFAYHYIVFAKSYFRTGQYSNFFRCVARSVSWDAKQIGYLLTTVKMPGNDQSVLNV